MGNLLERYGIKPDLSKRFSISFIDDFVDCSYRSFLGRFVKLPKDETVNLPTTFGSGCHRGLARINKSLMEEREPCLTCNLGCKLTKAEKRNAMSVDISKCKVKQIFQEEFFSEFDDDVVSQAMEEFIKKGKKAEGLETIEKLKRLGPACMESAMFERQPLGEVLAVEEMVLGKLGDFDLIGVIDLILGISGKSLITDYKTSGQKPSLKKFPLRQLAIYIHLLEEKGLPVNGIAALYMLKTEPPKKPRKGSPEHQQTFLNFFSLDKNRGIYNNTMEHIKEDMDMIRRSIDNGIFIRNRASMYCPCEYADYCENTKKLDKYVSNNN